MGIELAGRLEWWANPSTVLGAAEVELVVDYRDGALQGSGRLVTDDPEQIEGFEFLCALDSVFLLRLADNSKIHVNVHRSSDPREFSLTEFTGPTYDHGYDSG